MIFDPFEKAMALSDADGLSAFRLQIGGQEPIYLADHREPNGAYIENGLQRALALMGELPAKQWILRIDQDPMEPVLTAANLNRLHLSQPERVLSRGGFQACLWQLPNQPEHFRHLFREIIRSEISPMGLEGLCGTVSLLNPDHALIFRLTDDRSAVFSAVDPSILLKIRDNHGDWIL